MTSWQAKKLGDIAKIYDGTHQTPTYVERGVPFYSVEQVTANNFENTKFIAEDVYEKECRRVMIENGDVLMTRIGDIGTARYVDWSPEASFYVSLALIKPTGIDGHFLSYVINSHSFQKELWKRSLTVAFPYKINLGDIGKSVLQVPEKLEQERIVGVLEVWDEYIEKMEQKIALKVQLKKGLMQQLLTGKRRLPGFKSHLATREFKDVFKVMSKYPGYKSSDYSSQGQYPIYDQSYDRYVSGYTDEHDKVITPDQPLTLFGDHSRVVKYIDAESFAVGNDGIKLFKAQNDIDDYYAYLLLKSYRVPSTGYNRHFKYIADAVFDIPEPAEQRQISSVIKVSDDEIKVLYNKLSEVKLQKKYLLKNLITGAIRTPEDLKPLDTTRLERSAL